MKILSTMRIFSLLLLISVATSGSVLAQGTLRGVVTDSLNGETLIGANVILMGTAIGAATDIEGEFRIPRIPDGNYTVKVSYVGYLPKEFNVTIAGTRTTVLDVALLPDIIEGQEILITAQALGQAAAINQQLSSNTIVNVVSQEKIQQLPDANAAEAIGRLPGVSLTRSGGEASQVVMRGLSSKYSSITIDGVKIAATNSNDRGVDLSTISQGSLAGIELFKALTSDKDADALAGTVNLVTRKAPSQRTIRLDTKGSYNGLEKSAGQYNINGRYGERFFDDLLGVQINGNIERTIRSNENTDLDFNTTGTDLDKWNWSSLNITYSDEIRKRAGGSIILDVNTPDNGSIKLNTVYNQTSRDWMTHNRDYNSSGGVTYQYRDRELEIDIFSASLRGENYLYGFELDWNLALSESKVTPIVDYQMNFNEPSGSSSGMKNVPEQYLTGSPDILKEWVPYAWNNFSFTGLNNVVDQSSRSYDKEKTAFLNILRKYNLSNTIAGEFKFGGKYKSKSRTFDRSQSDATYYLWGVPSYVRLPDGTFKQKDFSGTRFDGLIGKMGVPLTYFLDDVPQNRNILDKYSLYPLMDRDAIKLWRELNINGFRTARNELFDTNAENPLNNMEVARGYRLTESVLSWYLMNSLNFGTAVTLITGLRVEYDNNDYFCVYSPRKLGGFNWAPYGTLLDINVNHKETTVLPNVQMIIKAADFLNIRLAGYQAMARPDFNQRLPRFVAAAASSPQLTIGNPNLKNAVAWNFEVQTQFYGNELGLFSINAFYKDIKNIHHSLSGIQVKGSELVDSLGVNWQIFTDTYPFDAASTYNLNYYYNSDKPTRVWGFEVEHQANFRFLPGLLKNIVLDYNFSIIRSETWLTLQRDEQRPNPIHPSFPPVQVKVLYDNKQKLPNQPEFRANASLGYDYEGFSFRLSYAYQGEYTSSISTSRRDDAVVNSFSRWDVAVTQQVTSYLKFLLNLNNITNAKETTSTANRLKNWDLIENASNLYGFTMDFGVRLDI